MGEQILFNEGGVQVTRSRIVVGNQTYPMHSITSVHVGNPALNRGCIGLLTLAGVLLLIIGTIGSLTYPLVAGLSCLGLMVFLRWRASRTHIITLGTAAGEQQVLTSSDERYIRRVASAIDAALVARAR